MKKPLFIITLMLLSCGGGERKLHPDEIYVCTGKYAKRFHCDEDCKGLQSCRGDIVVMSIEEAEDYGLTPCGYCY